MIILLIIALAAAGASFLVLERGRNTPSSGSRLDKADIVLGNASRHLEKGDRRGAVTSYLHIIETYPESPQAETALRKMADVFERSGDPGKARYYYKKLLADFPDADDQELIRERVREIDVERMASRKISEGVLVHEVKPGDSLYAIARKYDTTVPLIKKINDLDSDVIRLGQKLKVITSVFSIYVDKAENVLVLKKDGEPFKEYRVSTGENNSTPEGTFKIIDKVVDAPWTKPTGEIVLPGDPEYELGARWMAINEPGYGIHGTNDESTIGGQVTAGCVRMYNRDVVELYDIVPVGTQVFIVDTANVEAAPVSDMEPVEDQM
ncbi:MAG: L,D-transpeptidase family protein [Candidatus Omnitrophica bacterium]|nr:L,D-transpeptidase family protein [Candidatus Omnitrophota bacterium]